MSLLNEGFRFVYQRGLWGWVHPALVESGAVDATDMTDEEFERAVEEHPHSSVPPRRFGGSD